MYIRCVFGTGLAGGIIRITKQPTMGRVVHRAISPWGELSMGQTVHGASCHEASFDGASCTGIGSTI